MTHAELLVDPRVPSMDIAVSDMLDAVAKVIAPTKERQAELIHMPELIKHAYKLYVVEPVMNQIREEYRKKELEMHFHKAPEGFLWVCIYETVQCYGGPEEGGWWYDANVLFDAQMVPYKKARRTIRKMKDRAERMSEGDIHSVRPGSLFMVSWGRVRAKDETTVRPTYS